VHSESGIVVSRFRKHEVVEIKLYPVDLGLGKPRWQFGRPKLADRTLGEKIILRWAKLSEQFGTKIELKDGVGEVKLP
jgi:poly-gamma-glutamate synthesis protein (capsule biosynthesis protein)